MAANALVFASLVIASRWLGPLGYGVVGAMLGLLLIVAVPCVTFQTHVAREVAAAGTRGGGRGNSSAIVQRRMRQAAAGGVAVLVLSVAVAWPLAGLFDLASPLPIIVTGMAALPYLLVTVLRGEMQGREAFGALGVNFIVETVGRLAFVVVALASGLGEVGVCAAPAVGAVIALVWAWRAHLRSAPTGDDSRDGFLSGLIPTLVYFSAFAALTNVDVLVARARLDALASGDYAAAAFFGKIVLLVALAISIVLVPKVAVRHGERRGSIDLLAAALVYTLVLCGAVAAVGFVAPDLVLALTTGSEFAGAADVLGPYGLAMAAFAGVTVCGLHLLALGRFLAAGICAIVVPLEFTALIMVPASGRDLAWILAATGGLVLVLVLAASLRAEARPRHEIPGEITVGGGELV